MSRNKGRSTKRIIGERAFRYAISNLNIPQLQFAFGTSLSVYEKWAKQMKMAPVIDELGDGARLLWIGPKRVERVLFYLHGMHIALCLLRLMAKSYAGGCFLLPLTDFELDLFRYVQVESGKQNIHFGVAVLEYSASA
jgi:hypothetical protein